MFRSPSAYARIAWLLVIGVIAVMHFAAHQRQERRRAEHRSLRRTGQTAAGSVPDRALVLMLIRSSLKIRLRHGYRVVEGV